MERVCINDDFPNFYVLFAIESLSILGLDATSSTNVVCFWSSMRNAFRFHHMNITLCMLGDKDLEFATRNSIGHDDLGDLYMFLKK